MYFTVNLAFVDYLDQLNKTIDYPVIRNWTNQKQILPISLEPFEINSILLQAPKEFVNKYREKRKLMGFQEKAIKEKQNEQNSKFRMFVSSFITDTLLFSAALLTVVCL